MSKHAPPLLILTLIVPLLIIPVKPVSAADEGSWMPKEPMPTAREGLGVAVVQGKIYGIGGYNSNLELVGNNEMYDPSSDTWTTLAAMPTPRARFGIAVFQNKIYVVGGVAGSVPYFRDNAMGLSVMTGINEAYDPATNTWETKRSMSTERGIMQANTVNGKIYVTGGFLQNSQFSNATEVYDPLTDSWSASTPMPIYQEEFSSVSIDQKIYVISNIVQIFNTKNNQWTVGAPPPTSVYQGAAIATTGSLAPKRIYVFSGGSGSNQIYDPDNDSWSLGASMPNAESNRLCLAVAVVNDMIYAIGGSDPGASSIFASNYRYTPIGYDLSVASPSSTASASTSPTSAGITPEPFPTTLIIGSIITVAVVGLGLLIYLKKRRSGKTQ